MKVIPFQLAFNFELPGDRNRRSGSWPVRAIARRHNVSIEYARVIASTLGMATEVRDD